MSGFSYPPPIFESDIYNPSFYLSLDPSGFLTYAYAQTLYLDKNDYRLSYITGISAGSASAGVALVPDASNGISGLGAISCSSLIVAGSAVVAPPSYVVGITEGLAAASKALVLDGSRNIININSLTATTLTGTLSTASQPNITALGSLTSLTVSSSNSTTNSSLVRDYALKLINPANTNANQVGLVFGITATDPILYTGGASIVHARTDINSVGKLLFNVKISTTATDPLVEGFRINADATSTFNYSMTIAGDLTFSGASRSITGLSSISATTLTGALSTASQTSITAIGTLTGLTINGNLAFSGASRTITGLSSISATTLTGSISTAAQTSITSLGTLTGLSINGSLTFGGVGTTIISGLSQIDCTFYKQSGTLYDISLTGLLTATAGVAAPSKALILDSSGDIIGIDSLAATTLRASVSTAGRILTNTSPISDYNIIVANQSDVDTCTSSIAFLTNTDADFANMTPSAAIVASRSGSATYAGCRIDFISKKKRLRDE